jgi:hypothetical protein
MDIYEKIEEIRRKPENIRIRYVWAMVAIGMLFVLIIWLFSLKDQVAGGPIIPSGVVSSDVTNQLKQQTDDLQKNAASLKGMAQSSSDVNQQNPANNQ